MPWLTCSPRRMKDSVSTINLSWFSDLGNKQAAWLCIAQRSVNLSCAVNKINKINIYYFKPLNFGVICHAAMINQQRYSHSLNPSQHSPDSPWSRTWDKDFVSFVIYEFEIYLKMLSQRSKGQWELKREQEKPIQKVSLSFPTLSMNAYSIIWDI